MYKRETQCSCCNGSGRTTEEREFRVGDIVSIPDSSWSVHFDRNGKSTSIPMGSNGENRENWKIVGILDEPGAYPSSDSLLNMTDHDGKALVKPSVQNDVMITKGDATAFINRKFLAMPGVATERIGRRGSISSWKDTISFNPRFA